MRLKRTTAIACGGVLVLVAGYGLLQHGAEMAQGSRTGTTVTTAASAPTAATNAASRPVPAPSVGTPPTPASTATLPELWETLEASALAGDGPSACRLAIETLRCALNESTNALSNSLRSKPPDGELRALEAFVGDPTGMLRAISRPSEQSPQREEMRERQARLNREIDRHCGGVATERRADAFAFLRQSALAGVPDAQAVYAAWGAGTLGLMPGTWAEPTFERWLEEAPTVLQRMLDAGHPDAPRLLSEAYGRDGFQGWLFPYDPVRSVAYGQLALRIGPKNLLSGRMVEMRRQTLTSVQRKQADQLTAELYETHYAGRSPSVGERREYIISTITPRGGAGALSTRECELTPRPEEL